MLQKRRERIAVLEFELKQASDALEQLREEREFYSNLDDNDPII